MLFNSTLACVQVIAAEVATGRIREGIRDRRVRLGDAEGERHQGEERDHKQDAHFRME